ncbi:hypothetical protein F4779DRAFT_638209 [Xylariaceae sp. FL0662B]|nr:hypothetical protein F4779DRAFT_638209 [Xylariaceae sp. FL0662B]
MCDCVRVTFRYRCRHKHRKVFKCWAYNFKENHPCLGWLLPSCEPARTSKRKDRLCDKCLDHFSRYGDNAAFVADKFMAYKKIYGLSRKAIDPETVPRDEYLTSEERKQLRVQSNQPFHPNSPMRAGRAPTAQKTHLQPPPPVHQNKFRHRRPTPFEPHLKPPSPSASSFDLAARGALPSDYALSPKAPCPPVREHGTGEPIDLSDLVEPESDLEEDIILQGRPMSRSPHQPQALPHIRRKPVPQKSRCSLVRKMDEAAENIVITGYPNPESPDYPSVPQLVKAPKKPSWREDTPRPWATDSEGSEAAGTPRHPAAAPAAAAVSNSAPKSAPDSILIPGCSRHGTDYFDGCLQCRKGFFRERGLPSPTDEFVLKPAPNSAPSRPVTVSPRHRYTCAVQSSCYCRLDEAGNLVGPRCPPCCERETLKQKFGMDWI